MTKPILLCDAGFVITSDACSECGATINDLCGNAWIGMRENQMTKPITPEFVKAQIARLLLAFPDLNDDLEDLALSLASETDLESLMNKLILDEREAATNASAIQIWIRELQIRMQRFDMKQAACKKMMFELMDMAGIKKLPLPLATVSIVRGRDKVVITDERALPSIYVKTTREPRKAMIADALRTGHTVPGAELDNGEPHLTIRVK